MKSTHSQLLNLYNNGQRDAKKLMKLTGTPISTIYRILAKIRKGLSLEQKKIPGRPPILKFKDRQRLAQLAHHRDTDSARDFQIELSKRGSPLVHPHTIRKNKIWNELSHDYLVNLVNSMPHRIQRCIDLQGEPTGY